jgi:hypothetical protein
VGADSHAADVQEPPSAEPVQVQAPAVLVVSSDFALKAVREAWRAAGLTELDSAADSLATRARTSALLPELRLRALRSTDESLRYSDGEYNPTNVTQADGADLLLEGRLTWRLSRLVFAGEEVALLRLRGQQVAARQRIAKQVLDALFAWQAAQRALAAAALTEEAWDAWLDAIRAEAALYVLTDGWSAEELQRHCRKIPLAKPPAAE